MNEHALQASRVLMGDSLGFHIIFVLFGLTLPILVSWFEFLGIRKKDPGYTNIAKFWSKIMAVLVISGVISGTVIALQMSLVWPGILQFGGKVLGLPFMFETYAFLIEAIFLSFYMFTWGKVSPLLHWFTGLFVILGSSLSAYMITAVNAWMNSPVGFTYSNGKLGNVSVWDALTSRTTLIEFFHSMPAYFFAATIFVAGMYAFKLLKVAKKDRSAKAYKYDWVVVHKLVAFAAVLLVATGVMGDVTGKYLAKYEPTKLAAIELNYKTQSNAPLVLGGTGNDTGEISGPHIKIPGGLSILAGNSTATEVKGLNEVPVNERPPLYVHFLFDVKMLIVALLSAFTIAYFALRAWRPKIRSSRLFLLLLAGSASAGIILVELGWMLTEIGRQPWAVRGYVTTEQAVTKTHDITSFGYLFPLAYVVLGALTILAVKKIARDQKVVDAKGGAK
jgi:cytochrome d ubiquinol oxidase subunit I